MEGGLLSNLREVQCLICCLLHQMFIADPNIAKLVTFQVGQEKKCGLTILGEKNLKSHDNFFDELTNCRV